MKNRRLISTHRPRFSVPGKITRIGLSSHAKAVFLECMNNKEPFNPSLRFIQKHTGLSRSTVVRALNELIERNIIKKIKIGGATATTKYEFIEVKYWKDKKGPPAAEST